MYAPAHVGRGLARRWFGGTIPTCGDGCFGYVLRWTYGPGLGLLFARVRSFLPRHPVTAGLSFGAGIFAFEVVAMPAIGATPPVRSWRRAEPWLLILHTAVFGVATALTGDALISTRSRRR